MEKPLTGLTVCHFGHYNPQYTRNRIIAKALRRTGAEVIQVCDPRSFLLRYGNIGVKGLKTEFDLLLVGFPGHTDMPVAKLLALAKHTPVIFDAFLSLYDSNIQDRGIVQQGGIMAKYYFMIDKLSCQLADTVLLDTDAHITYFVDTFGVNREKFRRIWAGADDEIMVPPPDTTEEHTFTIFFYGSFIPLHGIEHIIEAARILDAQLQPVQFRIAGTGQTYVMMRQRVATLGLKNISFLGSVRYEELPGLMARSHACLGIFGTTSKVQRVIPNKVFDGLALKRPVITADTPAIRECLTHGKNIWLCPAGDGEALATAIVTLMNKQEVRRMIAEGGYEYFQNHFSIDRIAKKLTVVISNLLST
jgi:glycosyltransferase involved in cell wall biosynthesis